MRSSRSDIVCVSRRGVVAVMLAHLGGLDNRASQRHRVHVTLRGGARGGLLAPHQRARPACLLPTRTGALRCRFVARFASPACISCGVLVVLLTSCETVLSSRSDAAVKVLAWVGCGERRARGRCGCRTTTPRNRPSAHLVVQRPPVTPPSPSAVDALLARLRLRPSRRVSC